MELFFSECTSNYSNYTFAYCVYCYSDQREELPSIYNSGFLPYTGQSSIKREIFYLARSLRVDVANFEESSENRRILRKGASLNLQCQLVTKEEFDLTDPDFLDFCKNYSEERFVGSGLSSERLCYILNRDTFSHIFIFKSGERKVGFVLVALAPHMVHFWYSFFDTKLLSEYSLGKLIMLNVIRWAKVEGMDYVFLGTCYGTRSLYKVRDHKGIEFFDGSGWSSDIDLLSKLCSKDAMQPASVCDLFKVGSERSHQQIKQTVA